MSALYYAVNDEKQEAVELGHTGWLDDLKATVTEEEMREFVLGQLAKSHVNYDVVGQVEQLVVALFGLRVDRIILQDYDPAWFEITGRYRLTATIYGNKAHIGELL